MELKDCKTQRQVHDWLLLQLGTTERMIEASHQALTRMAEIARVEALARALHECEQYRNWHNKNDDGLSGFSSMAQGADECADLIRALQKTGGA